MGDISVLYDMEQALARQPIPATIIRAAFLMSNWRSSLETIRDGNTLLNFYPEDFILPMVSPDDLGHYAATVLLQPTIHRSVLHVEGPNRYSSGDVARAFSKLLGKPVRPANIPRDRWRETYQKLGFSPQAARSFERMTAAALGTELPKIEGVIQGSTSLESYLEQLLQRG